jgi:N-acetylglutamate synthase
MKLSKLMPSDFDKALRFWSETRGIGVSAVDTRNLLSTFLKRNPGLSFKVVDNDEVVATILCAHDGKRGYLHHIAISERYAGHGLARLLTDRSLEELRRLGIAKCHLFIDSTNSEMQQYWKSNDWNEQREISIFTHDLEYPAD